MTESPQKYFTEGWRVRTLVPACLQVEKLCRCPRSVTGGFFRFYTKPSLHTYTGLTGMFRNEECVLSADINFEIK
jgi:hypothetical protein